MRMVLAGNKDINVCRCEPSFNNEQRVNCSFVVPKMVWKVEGATIQQVTSAPNAIASWNTNDSYGPHSTLVHVQVYSDKVANRM